MFWALTITIAATIGFVVCTWLFSYEQERGQRLVAGRLRDGLDRLLTSILRVVHRRVIYIGRYIITLSWYYSIHAFLKLVLRFLAGIYNMVENLLHRNRVRAKKIRIERKQVHSHLTQIADHKTETSLSEVQKKKIKRDALEG